MTQGNGRRTKSVCSGDCAWGLGGSSKKRCGSPVSEYVHSERDMGQVSMLFFYNTCTLVIGTVPYIDRCVVVVK